MDEDVLVTLLKLAPKTRDSQVYKRHDVVPFGPKSGRAQYGEDYWGGENGKDKRGGKNGRGEKVGGDHCGNKINPMVEESSGFKVSVYHHKIYQCYQGPIVLG